MEDTRSIAVPEVDTDLADWVTDALDRVEAGLSAAVASDDGLLDSSARHLLDAGGDPLADDSVPAWCDCGRRTLSRSAMLEWIAAGERRVVVD